MSGILLCDDIIGLIGEQVISDREHRIARDGHRVALNEALYAIEVVGATYIQDTSWSQRDHPAPGQWFCALSHNGELTDRISEFRRTRAR